MSGSTAQPAYANFDIIVTEQTKNVYAIRGEYSRGGEDSVSGQTFPLNSPEFQNLLGALATLTGDLDQAEAAGRLMREHLFPGDIWALFAEKRSLAERDDMGLRLRLRIDPPEISMLPWEYCFDKDYDFFALRLDTPVVRYIDQPFTPEELTAPKPTRVLLATANPSGWDALDVEAEAAQIRDELQGVEDVQVEVLPHLTWDGLQLRLKTWQPHVFHFIGHGEFDLARERGRLVLEDSQGGPHKIRAKQLATLLRARGVQVVVLNACKTAAHSRSSAFMGIAPALVRAEIPAVIAMQFAIPDVTAHRFAQQLYRYLALGDPLDRAITEARINVSGYDEVFWAIPVLFMRAPDGVIWQPREDRWPSPSTEPEVPPEEADGASGAGWQQNAGETDREYLTRLRQLLTANFSTDELKTLCGDLGVDYEDLGGEGKTGKARELIYYVQRRGRLDDLVTLSSQRRPHV